MTTAPRSLDEDRSRRMRNYLVAMGIRTACFPIAVWAVTAEQYAVAWVAALGAIFIPSFAVMLANAVDRRQAPVEDTVLSPVRRLGPGSAAADGPRSGATDGPCSATTDGPRSAATDPLLGTVVSSRDTAYPAAGGQPDDGERGAGTGTGTEGSP